MLFLYLPWIKPVLLQIRLLQVKKSWDPLFAARKGAFWKYRLNGNSGMFYQLTVYKYAKEDRYTAHKWTG